MKKRVLATMLSLMVAAPMLFGCDMTAAAPAAAPAAEEAAAAVEEKAEEVAEAAEEVAEAAEEAVEEAAEAVEEVVEEAAAAPGKMAELTEIKFFTSNNKSASNEKVKELEDAINAISEPEINVHVTLIAPDAANYRSQMPLALAAGESYDLVFMMPMAPINLTTMHSANQLMDIEPYLEEYGPDILDVAGKYLDAVTIDGGIYMIPNIRNYASAEWWVIGQKYIDECGLYEDFKAIETVEDVEAIAEQLYDKFGIPVFAGAKNEDSMIQYHGTGGELLASSGSYEDNTVVIDNLGDNLYVLATDPETDTIYNIYDTEEFVNSCKKNQEWYDKGWIYKDSAFSEESQETICKNGAAMSIVVTSELGVEANKQATFNMPVYAVKFKNALVTSGVVSR
ncbi:MAG: extracellular solute-binding protein, partial [Lachnospiraceae bacterium]|nr:extracellular solute-binding protein [Lachnospiraceae bacterium]